MELLPLITMRSLEKYRNAVAKIHLFVQRHGRSVVLCCTVHAHFNYLIGRARRAVQSSVNIVLFLRF